MRAYVLGIDVNQRYHSDYLLKNVALRVCGHETTELAKAISDCQEAINNMHETAVKAHQHFDHVGLQGTVREELGDAEKDELR